jgi:hypothetical protein
MLLYTAGPYSGKNRVERDHNIKVAREIAADLWRRGYAVICPHTNTAWFDDDFQDITWEMYMAGDLEIVSRVDAVIMLPGWEHSRGANMEREHAISLGIPVYTYPEFITREVSHVTD